MTVGEILRRIVPVMQEPVIDGTGLVGIDKYRVLGDANQMSAHGVINKAGL